MENNFSYLKLANLGSKYQIRRNLGTAMHCSISSIYLNTNNIPLYCEYKLNIYKHVFITNKLGPA